MFQLRWILVIFALYQNCTNAKMVDVEVSLPGYVCKTKNPETCGNTYKIFASNKIQVDNSAIDEDDAYSHFVASTKINFNGIDLKVYQILWNKLAANGIIHNSSSTFSLMYKFWPRTITHNADGSIEVFSPTTSDFNSPASFSYNYGNRQFVKLNKRLALNNDNTILGTWIFPSVVIRVLNP